MGKLLNRHKNKVFVFMTETDIVKLRCEVNVPSIFWSSFFTFCSQPSQWILTLRRQFYIRNKQSKKNQKFTPDLTLTSKFKV
jgi:hypothetical protein